MILSGKLRNLRLQVSHGNRFQQFMLVTILSPTRSTIWNIAIKILNLSTRFSKQFSERANESRPSIIMHSDSSGKYQCRFIECRGKDLISLLC
jgi:hypothetical protein